MTTADSPSRRISRSTDVSAPPESVWALVSDLPAMGRFSPENTGGAWKGGATGPAVGARFTGRNSRGPRRWSTAVVVSRCEPGEAFAFDVSSFGLAVARWSYELTATPTGCTLTETWEDRRGRLIGVGGRLVTGVSDRERFTTQSIDATLAAVKEHAERSEGGSRGAR